MSSNIFEEIQNKRNQFKKYAQRALENKWIDDVKFCEILSKLENDKLTIGVIGQMKCGKSTFLNALIFQDEILPAATTPMTASLSIITYGEQKKLEVEFYTTNEWEELKFQASRNVEEVKADQNLVSKIKAAKEIISKSISIQDEIENLLGTKKQDVFENLIQYVGADGKYIAITKAVKIFYPLDYLKGVEIVDTPGFNDPVVSREERTKDFLSKADVVVMLLYAGRPFDATDKDIIFNKVRTVGVGKVLIGINKYDLCYNNGESKEEILLNVKNELQKASQEYQNSSIAELVQEQDPLLISANMALMSRMPMSKISGNANLKFYYQNALDSFEIDSQVEMYDKSLMKEFEDSIKNIVTKSKDEILIRKPKNQIKQIGENKIDELIMELTNVTNNLKILETPDDELDELLKSSEKAKKRIQRKIENLETDLFEIFLNNIKKITYNTDDSFAGSEKKIYALIEATSVWSLEGKFESLYNYEFGNLERKTKRDFGNFNDEINLAIKKEINNFLYDIEEIVEKFLEDFDIKDYFGKLKRELLVEVVNITIYDLLPEYKNLTEEEKSSLLADIGEFVFVSAFAIPIAIFGLANIRGDLRGFVNDQFLRFDTVGIGQNVKANGNKLIQEITKLLLDDLIIPIEQKISDSIGQKSNKENELKSNKEKLEFLRSSKSLIETQIEEMRVLENQF